MSVDASPSRTAVMAAVSRGRHAIEDPPAILHDPLTLELVGPAWTRIADSGDRRRSPELARQSRASMAVRSRYAEDRLALGRYGQYVLLGAGLDTYAWRHPGGLDTLTVVEVDHPASQAWKRRRLDELGLPVHERHVFAPVDFEVTSLDDGLDAAGVDRSVPTLFSWLGVVPYLTEEAVERMLRTVARWAPGSEVVLEYALPRSALDDVGLEFATMFSPVATRVGEPLRHRSTPAGAERLVTRCGLMVTDHPDRGELTERYFADRADGLRPWSVSRLLAATVP